ncbi:MAG: mannose-6-phosphate isomerase [candidate division Zixibacteria bacterium SM23_73_2]|nr:MAG: mannose-6-phosphate isomerase [candidate division Zixibacteria bacterium SM23_73_2]
MFIKDLKKCEEILSGDNTILNELINPLKDKITTRYSLAHAKLKPNQISLNHRLRSSEVYYILKGKGEMFIDNERKEVFAGQVIYIPPNSIQRIRNIGEGDLEFLCIVDPAWRPEDEEVLE